MAEAKKPVKEAEPNDALAKQVAQLSEMMPELIKRVEVAEKAKDEAEAKVKVLEKAGSTPTPNNIYDDPKFYEKDDVKKIYVLRLLNNMKWSSLRGVHKEISKIDNLGRNMYKPSISYQFDGNCRMEATERARYDLEPFINDGLVKVYESGEFEDEIDYQLMDKITILKEFKRYKKKTVNKVPVEDYTVEELRFFYREMLIKMLTPKG